MNFPLVRWLYASNIPRQKQAEAVWQDAMAKEAMTGSAVSSMKDKN
jgi:hypothetical protein